MRAIMSTMRSALLGVGATLIVVAAAHGQINDAIRGAPSEANHFIETRVVGCTRRRRGVSPTFRPT